MVVCAAAIVWFIVAFLSQWSPQTDQPTIIGLYAIGLLVMAVGGVFVPILMDRAELEARASALQAALDDLREAIRETEADEADLAAQLRSLRDSQSRFELYEDRGEQWRWRLPHRNGNIVADSGEGYTRKHNAQKGMQTVPRDALDATILLVEREEELPAEDEEFKPVEDQASRADFELYEDNAGEYRWRLRHRNGNILSDSGEGYSDRSGAWEAIEGVKRNAPNAGMEGS